MTEQERVERFETAYNRIDRALSDIADRNGEGRRRTWASKVRIAANRVRRLGRHVDFLHEIGELRNAIVHNRTGDERYIAVPHEETVLQLERIERELSAPQRAIPRFQRKVTVLAASGTLSEVFNLIRRDGYSRYPVYDDRTFVGLLTSNGVARWCAARASDGRFDVDASRVTVTEVLAADHRRNLVEFLPADAPVGDIAAMFHENPRLEAILITKHGRSQEPPVGLVSASDLLGIERDDRT
jgi:CBS domain-containing protein